MIWTRINDDTMRRYVGSGIPWCLVDDDRCRPDGALRQHLESMLQRGLLVERNGIVYNV